MQSIFLTVLVVLSATVAGVAQKISITIDDLPLISTDNSVENQKYVINQLISHGEKYDASLIGFVNEGKIFKNSAQTDLKINLLKQWLESGFELGNHGYAHLNFDKYDTTTYFEDILKGEKVSKQLCKEYNSPFTYFRHPYLHAGDTEEKEIALEMFLERNGYQEAPVTIDNSDWIFARGYDLAIDRKDLKMKQQIADAYVPYMISKLKYYEDRAAALFDRKIDQVLLIHANRINADLLGDLLAAIQKKGYTFDRLSEVLKDKAYQSDDHIAKPWGISWIQRWGRNVNMPSSFYRDEPACPKFLLEYTGLSE
ncbi:MAG: polysaccharide deacetylase family protein [Bacteroidota bacterium]